MTETPIQPPQKVRREIDAKLRARIETAVEKLISALDTLDAPTQDDEDGGDDEPEADDEPSLGAIETHSNSYSSDQDGNRNCSGDQTVWARGTDDDREGEYDGAEQEDDSEPSLGSFDRMTDQSKSWRMHYGLTTAWACVDAELDRSDYEPALGSLERHPSNSTFDQGGGSQVAWGASATDDSEHDDSDREPEEGV